jgi:hypothetical protein
MANNAPAMIWRSNRDKLCDFFNQGWLNSLAAQWRPTRHRWADGVHPKDLEHCLQTCRTAFDAREPFERNTAAATGW